MYLLDTNVVSELRKGERANSGVRQFFRQLEQEQARLYLSAITLGELRRGVDLVRHRGDREQADLLEDWLGRMLEQYADHILAFGGTEACIWGRLRVPHAENALDKQIAATALVYDLVLVTRNTRHFAETGARLLNPFS